MLEVSYSKRTFAASFKADPELWSDFKATCKMRGVSVCHVLEGLMQAWMEGQKVTATLIKPVTINLKMEHIVKRPRRKIAYCEIEKQTYNRKWPPPCPSADELFPGSHEVGCLKKRDIIKLSDCWACFLMGHYLEPPQPKF
jgi:hypothetical protein